MGIQIWKIKRGAQRTFGSYDAGTGMFVSTSELSEPAYRLSSRRVAITAALDHCRIGPPRNLERSGFVRAGVRNLNLTAFRAAVDRITEPRNALQLSLSDAEIATLRLMAKVIAGHPHSKSSGQNIAEELWKIEPNAPTNLIERLVDFTMCPGSKWSIRESRFPEVFGPRHAAALADGVLYINALRATVY